MDEKENRTRKRGAPGDDDSLNEALAHDAKSARSSTDDGESRDAKSDLTPDGQLVQFYSQSIRRLEDERKGWLAKLDACKAQPAELV